MNCLLALSFGAMAATPESIARDLRSLVRGDVEFDAISRCLYATDAGLTQIEPLGVVSPRDDEDVVRLVAYAAERGLSLVPRGMGSGLNGGAVGSGIQVDFSRHMNCVVEVAPDSSWVRVQPGVVLAQLNELLRPRGVFFPPDPSSESHCSLGGMIGTNASGARTIAYGATKDHVLSLEVVMADGSLYQAGPVPTEQSASRSLLDGGTLAGRAFSTVLAELTEHKQIITAHMPKVVKNSCGYRVETLLDYLPLLQGTDTGLPLQKLFVGAEGTLGIVTEATLHLAPLPAKRGIAMAYFRSVSACGLRDHGLSFPSACPAP
jgi:FAD/FMN-containing dehydrogenase